MFKDLNEVPPSDYRFPYEYIDAEVNKKVDKTKGQLAGNEMEKETKYYVESLNNNPNWLMTITSEIDKFLINCEYINFFTRIYMQWSKDDDSNSSSQTLIIPRLLRFENMALLQLRLYIEAQTMTQYFVCRNFQKTILIRATARK